MLAACKGHISLRVCSQDDSLGGSFPSFFVFSQAICSGMEGGGGFLTTSGSQRRLSVFQVDRIREAERKRREAEEAVRSQLALSRQDIKASFLS